MINGQPTQRMTISSIVNGEIHETFSFQVNPEKISRSKEALWVDLNAPGTMSNRAMFVHTTNSTIDLDIILVVNDSRRPTRERTVVPEIAQFESMLDPAYSRFLESDQFAYVPPPTLLLTVGSRTWKCTARKLNIEEIIHNKDLEPQVARISLQLMTHHDSFKELRSHVVRRQELKGSGREFSEVVDE